MVLGLILTILAAIATNMLIGMLWYGPLFGQTFIRAMGWEGQTKEELKEHSKNAGPGYMFSMAGAMIGSALIYLLFDLDNLIVEGGAAINGLVLGAFGAIAFLAPASFTTAFFEGTDKRLTYLSIGYWSILFCLYGLYAGIFQAQF